MRVNAMAMTLLVSLAAAQSAYAQDTAITGQPFMRAALTVMTFDYFATKCKQGRGFVAADSAKIEAWQTANGVNQIRVRMRDLDRYPSQQQEINQAFAQITEKVTSQNSNIDACAVALSISKLPDSQFATVSPQLLAQTSSPAKKPQRGAQRSVSTPVSVTSGANAKIAAQIDSFGFNSRPTIGIGGFVAIDIYPVVLFRNGDALTDVEGLSFPGGLEAHKRLKPDNWTRWRRQGGELQLAQKGGWKALPFRTTYPKLPDNFKLDGLFRSLSGTGTVAIGGSQSLAVWQDYRFSADGRVVRGNGAGGSAEAGDVAIATSNIAPNRRGRYRVQGMTLHITYDDGSRESRILITDPKDPKSAIWLDGVSYVRRKQ